LAKIPAALETVRQQRKRKGGMAKINVLSRDVTVLAVKGEDY
jgi:hypothetical protein